MNGSDPPFNGFRNCTIPIFVHKIGKSICVSTRGNSTIIATGKGLSVFVLCCYARHADSNPRAFLYNGSICLPFGSFSQCVSFCSLMCSINNQLGRLHTRTLHFSQLTAHGIELPVVDVQSPQCNKQSNYFEYSLKTGHMGIGNNYPPALRHSFWNFIIGVIFAWLGLNLLDMHSFGGRLLGVLLLTIGGIVIFHAISLAGDYAIQFS